MISHKITVTNDAICWSLMVDAACGLAVNLNRDDRSSDVKEAVQR